MKKILAVATVVIFLVSLGGTAVVGSQPERIPVIVVFKERPDAALVRAHGGGIKYTYYIIPGIACSLPQEAIDALMKNPNVAYIEEDYEVHVISAETSARPVNPGKPAGTPGDSTQPPQTLPWGIDRIDADIAWSTDRGAGVKVAVLDTGIDKDHPDLETNVHGGISYVDRNPDKWDDRNGHGTHCAGVIAALDNDIGVVGVAPEAWLYAVKVLNSAGSGYVSDVIAGIEWSVDNNMQVISMSFGSNSDANSLHTACNNAYAAGLLLVAAAGNNGGVVSYPARYSSVIAVSATDESDIITSWSNYGPDIEVGAPGDNIYSTYKNGGYETLSGTSMACPHVTATVALILVNPMLTNEQAREVLHNTAEDLGAVGFDPYYGYGLVDAGEAVAV